MKNLNVPMLIAIAVIVLVITIAVPRFVITDTVGGTEVDKKILGSI